MSLPDVNREGKSVLLSIARVMVEESRAENQVNEGGDIPRETKWCWVFVIWLFRALVLQSWCSVGNCNTALEAKETWKLREWKLF